MRALAVVAALLVPLLAMAQGYTGGYEESPSPYQGGYMPAVGGVDLATLGGDMIAGVNWTPAPDFTGGDVWYFDVNADPGGVGTIGDPFQSFGVELHANQVIEQWDRDGVLQNSGTAVVGAGDVCVLRGGNHGKFQIDDMRFSDYVGVVAMPGEKVLFDYASIRVGRYWYFERVDANPANTRNSGAWPTAQEHLPNDYGDYDDGPWFVYIGRDSTFSNYTSSNIVFNKCNLGISSGDLPATWGHEDWNNAAVGGVKIVRTPYVQIQKCYGVGLSQVFNVSNQLSGTPTEPFTVVNCNNIFNNNFKHINGDGIYVHHAQYTEVKGNTWVDTYTSNDDHVVMVDVYPETANNIFDGNKLILTSERRPLLMPGYESDCAGGVGNCEGKGQSGFNLIGENTNNIVRNNIIHGNRYKLINIRTLYGSSYNVQVTNNTLTCDTLRSWNESSAYAQIGTQISTIGEYPGFPVGDTLQVHISNNICSEILIDLPEDEWSTEANNSVYGFDYTGAGFVDWVPERMPPTKQNVSLTAASDNVDAGDDQEYPETDFTGGCRAYGSAADIGAYEYNDGGPCTGPVKKTVFIPVASVDHLHDSADTDLATANEVIELGIGKDAVEFSWVHVDSVSAASSSSAWLAYAGRWEKEQLKSTKLSWDITGDPYTMLGLYYIDWSEHIPAGATVVSAEMHVTVTGTWWNVAGDSISATLMDIPEDNRWYTSKGVNLSVDAAPNMSHANWTHQILKIDSNGYPKPNATDDSWYPPLADRATPDDWGDVSDLSWFPGDVNLVTNDEYAITITECVQAALDGTTNNGIVLTSRAQTAGDHVRQFYSIEPRPTTGPHTKVPWFTVSYYTTQ